MVSDSSEVPSLVVRVVREWPWGLAMWSDLESNEPPPEEFDDYGVAAADTVIVGPIMHEADGPGTAEVWTGEPPQGIAVLYDGTFDLPSGRVALSDAAMEQVEVVVLPAGRYRARLVVDDPDFPERASVYLVPLA
jgi:hypothetical protein